MSTISDVSNYVCLRLLEVECGFPSVYNETLEAHFKELDDEFNYCKHTFSVYQLPMAKDFIELDEHYMALLRGIMSEHPSQVVDATAAYTIFLITRNLIQFYKYHHKSEFAMVVCFRMRNFLRYCTIDWDEPRNTYFYRRMRRSYRETVCNKLFDIYTRLLSWL